MEITNKIHDELLNWLISWNYRNKNDGGINPYFRLRTKNDERFKKGFWFVGDEKYITISFWTGGDSMNRTPNIFLDINVNNGISVKLVGRDSEAKARYFRKLADYLGYHSSRTKGVFQKILSKNPNTYIKFLEEFVENDKVLIDNFLNATLQKVDSEDYDLLQDEFSSPLGFLTQEEFDISLAKTFEEKSRIEHEVKVETHKGEPLPIYLREVKIETFKGIDFTGVDNLPGNANWIFLTGENGSGKSTVLQAIALSLTNYEENKSFHPESSSVRSEFYHNEKFHVNYISFSNSEQFVPLNNYFSAYGPIRLNVQAESSVNQEGRNSSAIYNLFKYDGLLKNVEYLLYNSKLSGYEQVFENLVDLIKIVTDGMITDVKIDGNKVIFSERDGDKLTGGLKLEQLASGYQSIINILGDIIIRLSASQIKTDIKNLKGIVIIDEIENHLHPKLQRKLPSLLTNIFPKIQFIASTHSPIPLLGAPENSVILNVKKNIVEKIHITRLEKLEKELKYLMPNTILTSDIFDLENLESINNPEGKDMYWEDNFDDVEKNKQVTERLKNLDKSIFPDNLFNEEL